MPELPEVQTITSDLKKTVLGYTIAKTVIAKNYAVLPSKEQFNKLTIGQKIVGVERIAKNIVIHLENGKYIKIHLAMTGRLLFRDPKNKEDRWNRVIFILHKDELVKHLRYCDVRMFGKVEALEIKEYEKLISKYGPEILDEKLTSKGFLEIIHSKKTNIKNLLLDQKKVSGLGNIYATDALFLAKIHPEKATLEINLQQAEELLKACKKVLKNGIKNRGSTLKDKTYVDLFGKEGSHQNHFEIYSKDSCPACKSKTSFIKLNGRGTYYCPKCQKSRV